MNPKSPLLALMPLLGVSLLVAANPVQTDAAERTEHKELPAISGGSISFKSLAGSIDIKTHDQSSVIYDATLKSGGGWFGGRTTSLEDVVFDYKESNGRVTITVAWKDGRAPRNSNLNAQHRLVVPVRYNLELRTGGGGITADGITGNLAAHTSGGSIGISNVNGDVKANTSGGGIKLDGIKGNAEVRTSGGSIQIGEITGDVSARTSGGSVTAKAAGQIAKPIELATSGGSIRLTVPTDFKANLNASTSGGGVLCELPVEGTKKRDSIKGKLNGGGPKVTLHTSGGSIRVVAR